MRRLADELDAQKALLADVRHCLPDDLAAHCVSARMHDGILVVHTDAAAWATRIRFLAPQLSGVLRPEYPTLRDIKVRLLGDAPRGRPRPATKATRSTAAATIIHTSATHATPGPLRDALYRLARAVTQDDAD
ncbi:MAG: DUF721 domain-containing protein [Chromatiaceae bacterium]